VRFRSTSLSRLKLTLFSTLFSLLSSLLQETRRSDLTPKQRLIHQLHYRWTQIHPYVFFLVSSRVACRPLRFPASFSTPIFDRELECWSWYAPVVHHFSARSELCLYLREMVVRDQTWAHDDTQAAREDKPTKVLRGLLSGEQWIKIIQGYDEEVQKVEGGKRDNYEEWRAKQEKERKE